MSGCIMEISMLELLPQLLGSTPDLILIAMAIFAYNHFKNSFREIDRRFDRVEGDIKEIKSDLKAVKTDIVRIQHELVEIRYQFKENDLHHNIFYKHLDQVESINKPKISPQT